MVQAFKWRQVLSSTLLFLVTAGVVFFPALLTEEVQAAEVEKPRV